MAESSTWVGLRHISRVNGVVVRVVAVVVVLYMHDVGDQGVWGDLECCHQLPLLFFNTGKELNQHIGYKEIKETG